MESLNRIDVELYQISTLHVNNVEDLALATLRCRETNQPLTIIMECVEGQHILLDDKVLDFINRRGYTVKPISFNHKLSLIATPTQKTIEYTQNHL